MKRKLRLGDGYALTKHKLNRHYIQSISLLAVLTSMCLYAQAQAPASGVAAPAALGRDIIKPLQVGDTVPKELWHYPMQAVNHPGGRETVTLDEYKGKLIILDFWATWCGSCIAAMPAVRIIEEKFQDDIVVVPVSWDSRSKTKVALENNKTLIETTPYSIIGSETMLRHFPHRVLPHYIWIGKKGELIATTASDDITEENIERVIDGKTPEYTLKSYIDMDSPLLLKIEDMPKNVGVSHYSLFIEGNMPSLSSAVKAYVTDGIVNGYRICNRTLKNIYQIIGSKIIDSIPLFGGIGKKRFLSPDSISEDVKYTFDFIVPTREADSLYVFMLATLNRVSGYDGKWVTRTRQCLVLRRSNPKNRLLMTGKASERNSGVLIESMAALIGRLDRSEISGDRIVIDDTRYKGPVSFIITSPFDNLDDVRHQLDLWNLELVEEEREVQVFELSKP